MTENEVRCSIQFVLGEKCAVKMPRGPCLGRERSEIDSLLSSGHLYHDKDCDFVALTDAGRAAMGLPRLRCDLVYDANVIPGLERQAAAAIMAREPDLLRAHIACLESLDRRLLRACQEEFVLREPVEPLLCDGAYPSAEAVCAAIANLHYGALVEFRKLGATWVAITGMDIDDVKVALRKGAGKMGWPDILETLIDWGLEPAPWMAAMARDARCPECLGMMRKRGMTEEPEEQCSEPVAVMMRVRCHAVVRALDSTTTLHTYTDADGPCCEINCGDQVSFIGAAHETLALREAVRLVAMRDGRYDAATDRVRLTGLEVE